MKIAQELRQLGLSHAESSVYLYLLEYGVCAPPAVAHGTAIARTNCYHLLQSLKGKGLINEARKGKRNVYIARDPRALLESLERKKEVIESILPDLRGLYTAQKNKPKIRFYEGWEEVKEIYWETLLGEEIKAIGSTEQLSEVDHEFFVQYQRALQRKKIIFYDILTHASTKNGDEIKTILDGLYEAVFLPAHYKDTPTDILLWNGHIALITLQAPIFGTVLTSPLLAQTFTMIFQVLWENLKHES